MIAAISGIDWVRVDCGEHGVCVNMSMTATCECKTGYVARPRLNFQTALTCVKPSIAIPASFYGMRMPDRTLPAGREVRIVEVTAPPERALPSGTEVHVVEVEQQPQTPSRSSSSSCAIASGRSTGPGGALAVAALAFALGAHGRRRKRSAQ